MAYCFAVGMTESSWSYYVPVKGMVEYAKLIFDVNITVNLTCSDAMRSLKAAITRLEGEVEYPLKGSLEEIVFTKDTAHCDRTWEKHAGRYITNGSVRR